MTGTIIILSVLLALINMAIYYFSRCVISSELAQEITMALFNFIFWIFVGAHRRLIYRSISAIFGIILVATLIAHLIPMAIMLATSQGSDTVQITSLLFVWVGISLIWVAVSLPAVLLGRLAGKRFRP